MSNANAPKFVFKKEPGLIAWPCTISVPQDGGIFQEQTLTARFKVLDADKFKELSAKGDRELLKEVIAGFDGFMDEHGAAVETEMGKACLFKLPYAVEGLVKGYLGMMGNRVSKN